MQLVMVDIKDVVIGPRHRQVDEDEVRSLSESMAQIGLQTPISIWTGEDQETHLVAGGHRIRAAQLLGWDQIPATVVDLDEMRRELWEIDENLCRAELSAGEEAKCVARRKAIYESLYPETKKGVAGARAKHGHANDKMSFAADTAKRTRKSKRHVQRAARRGHTIAGDVLTSVNGTPMDKATHLDAIVKLSHDDQRRAVAMVQEGHAADLPAAKAALQGQLRAPANVVPVLKPVANLPRSESDTVIDAIAQHVATLISAWEAAPPEARERFRAHIDHESEAPQHG